MFQDVIWFGVIFQKNNQVLLSGTIDLTIVDEVILCGSELLLPQIYHEIYIISSGKWWNNDALRCYDDRKVQCWKFV